MVTMMMMGRLNSSPKTMSRCGQCGGDLSRVGLFGCNEGHPVPNRAQRIARLIEDDLNDRRGLHLSSLDDETRNAIVDRWEGLIQGELDHG